MTLAYFLVASLDLIGALFTDTKESDRNEWIEWVWDQQLREPPLSFSSSWSPLLLLPPELTLLPFVLSLQLLVDSEALPSLVPSMTLALLLLLL